MSKLNFEQRCTLAQNSLPQAEYRTWLTALHTEMLARIAELEVCWNACEGLDIDHLARFGLGSATGSEIHRLREQNAELLARIVELEAEVDRFRAHALNEKAARKALEKQPAMRGPLTTAEVEQLLARWDYQLHGDRARYLVRETEKVHGIKTVEIDRIKTERVPCWKCGDADPAFQAACKVPECGMREAAAKNPRIRGD